MEGAWRAGEVRPRRRQGSSPRGAGSPPAPSALSWWDGRAHATCHSPISTQACAPSFLGGKNAAALKAKALFHTYLNYLRKSPAPGMPRPRGAGLSLPLKILFQKAPGPWLWFIRKPDATRISSPPGAAVCLHVQGRDLPWQQPPPSLRTSRTSPVPKVPGTDPTLEDFVG